MRKGDAGPRAYLVAHDTGAADGQERGKKRAKSLTQWRPASMPEIASPVGVGPQGVLDQVVGAVIGGDLDEGGVGPVVLKG